MLFLFLRPSDYTRGVMNNFLPSSETLNAYPTTTFVRGGRGGNRGGRLSGRGRGMSDTGGVSEIMNCLYFCSPHLHTFPFRSRIPLGHSSQLIVQQTFTVNSYHTKISSLDS